MVRRTAVRTALLFGLLLAGIAAFGSTSAHAQGYYVVPPGYYVAPPAYYYAPLPPRYYAPPAYYRAPVLEFGFHVDRGHRDFHRGHDGHWDHHR